MKESPSANNTKIALHTLRQMTEACNLIQEWNASTNSINDYLESSAGMQRLAASCMLIESLGEGIKKIDKLLPDFLSTESPEIPWKSIKGMRDYIAHGYFNIDAEMVFDVVKNEIQGLKEQFVRLEKILITKLDKQL